MVFFNWATMQMAAKIVYYGPGLCGKTSNLSYIYAKTSPKSRGEMVSLETESDRTLFFDLLPIEVGTIGGFKTRLQLYTVPGQVFYNTTRQLVLKGVDGLVFVADSQRPMRAANIESFKSLMENIKGLGLNIDDLPLVLQYNKRDLENLLTEEELGADLNPNGTFSWHLASAINGEGVFETLKEITKVTLKKLRKRMAAPQADASPQGPRIAAPTPAPKEPVPAGSPSPISASSLARAAEEGAGDGFPIPEEVNTPAFGEAEVQAQAAFGGPELPSADPDFEDTAFEIPADGLESDEPFEPADMAEPTVEAGAEDDDDGPSPNEITSPSIGNLHAGEPFGRQTTAVDEPDEWDMAIEEDALEEVEDFEDAEDSQDEIVEFDTDADDEPAVVPPPVKRVHVSDESDILAQLDGLRRHATETTFGRGRGGAGQKDLDLDSLLATGESRTRDLKRTIEHSLNSNLFKRMRSMQVAFRIQDDEGNTIHTLDPVSVKIDDASVLEKLILQLTIDLENLL